MTEPIYPPLIPPPPSPYQAPQSPLVNSGLDHKAVREKLKVISIVFLCMTAVSIAITGPGTLALPSSGSAYVDTLPEPLPTTIRELFKEFQAGGDSSEMGPDFENFYTAAKFLSYIQLVILVIVLVGTWKMFKAENYGLAMAAAVLASIPCVGSGFCCLGMIPGIWSLIILLKPEIKAGFL